MFRSRLAPTPSGLLHLGNAVNFALTWVLTRAHGGSLRLRIDDADRGRSRVEYVDDIFRQLEWLGLDWDEGPSSVGDFQRHHSQLLRLDRYRQVLQRLTDAGFAYPCGCSRAAIARIAPDGIYPGTCRHRPPPEGCPTAIRLRLPSPAPIAVDGHQVDLAKVMGDFVLWRKDDLPAYQLASLVDDLDMGIDLVVRGDDLLASTAAQLHLATCLGEDGAAFRACRFVHHPLLTDTNGAKLAKSRGSLTLAAMRRDGATPAVVFHRAAAMLGMAPPWPETAGTFLERYRVEQRDSLSLPVIGRCRPPVA